eukprot:7347740-Prymnesium_polylepis.1
MGAAELRARRSDTFYAVQGIVGALSPAVAAGKPWGVAPNGAAAGPPNQPLLQAVWLLLQWSHP